MSIPNLHSTIDYKKLIKSQASSINRIGVLKNNSEKIMTKKINRRIRTK